MVLKGSGMSNNKAATSPPLGATARWCLLAVLTGATLLATPNLASASLPKLVEGTAKVTLDLARSAVFRSAATDDLWLKPTVQPKPTVLVSSDLVDSVTNILANGIQVTRATREGALFLDFEQRGFRGVLVLRYRR
jgi:hypothetical protein